MTSFLPPIPPDQLAKVPAGVRRRARQLVEERARLDADAAELRLRRVDTPAEAMATARDTAKLQRRLERWERRREAFIARHEHQVTEALDG